MALGPVITDKLRSGEAVTLPGVGILRVVRVEEHKDLATGLPTRVPPANYIEFVPTAELSGAANAPGAVPALVVPPNEFIVNPNSNPGVRTGGMRTGGSRTR